MSAALHAAVTARARPSAPGPWLRDQAAGIVGAETMPVRRSRHRRPSERQAALRDATRNLGAIGALVAEGGWDDALAAEIRTALSLVVAAVAPSR
jgi:hypothetical protein